MKLPPTLIQSFQTVNNGVSELVNIKIASYQKLYEANNLEVEETLGNISKNQATLDKTPGLKSDLISGRAKMDNSRALKQNSDSAANANDKLNNLAAAIKKQLEAIKQLNNLNTSLNKLALKGEAQLANQNQQKNNIIQTNTDGSLIKNQDNPASAITANNKTIELTELAKQDTTTGQLL